VCADLADAISTGVLAEHRARSLQGKIAWMRVVHPAQLDVVDELLRHLPASVTGGRRRKTEDLPCNHRRSCRAQRWSIPVGSGAPVGRAPSLLS
jgi:hypothetical protein